MVPWARRVLQDTIEMQEMMDSLKDGMAGRLEIACSTTAGKYVLPHLAGRFSIRHPNVQTKLLRCTPATVISNLLEGEANLGVVSYEIPGKDIELQEFFQDRITVIVPRDHDFVSKEQILPEDLIGEHIIFREETSGTRKVFLSELAKHDISLDDLNVFMEVGNAEAIVRTVASGYGISFVSKLASACAIDRGNVVSIPIAGMDLVRTIYMVRKRLKEINRPADAFWRYVHDPSNKDLIELASRGDLHYTIRDL
jgi:DNA-binding transcriptional LysR family regulator